MSGTGASGGAAEAVVADLAGLALASETLESALGKVAAAARRRLPAVLAASTTLVNDGKPTTAAFDGDASLHLDEGQYEQGYGPCLDAANGGEVLYIRDMREEDRWPRYTPGAVEIGVLSSLSVAMPMHTSVSGALNLYAAPANGFDEASIEAAKVIASVAAGIVLNMYAFSEMRREGDALRRAMESRAVIEQAKGVLMAKHRVPAETAFATLVKMSQSHNVKLREVAGAIVYQALGGDGAAPPDLGGP